MKRSRQNVINTEIRAVLDSIRRIVRALRIASRAAEKTVGLSGAQVFVLQQLQNDLSLSVNEIADRTFTHQSSVSEVVQRLVEKGLVERRQSPEDGRRVELTLTSAGRASLRKVPFTPQEKLIVALEKMPGKRRLQVAMLLNELVDAAGLSEEPAAMLLEEEHGGRGARKQKVRA